MMMGNMGGGASGSMSGSMGMNMSGMGGQMPANPMPGMYDSTAMAGMGGHTAIAGNTGFGGLFGGLLTLTIDLLALFLVIGLIIGTVVAIKRYLLDGDLLVIKPKAVCTRCGSYLDGKWNYCSNCGTERVRPTSVNAPLKTS